MPLTPRNKRRLRGAPDRDEVILPAGEDVLAVWRPADARETAVVRIKEIRQPRRCEKLLQQEGEGDGGGDVLLLQVVNYPQ